MGDNYILFNTLNGAELIGKVVGRDETHIRVEHPLVIRPVQRGPNDFVLDLIPHSLSNPEGVHKFPVGMIIVSEETPKELTEAYTKRISNIVIAQTLDGWEGKK